MSLRRGREFSLVDVVIWKFLFINFLVKKCLFLSFELMESHFTTVGPLEIFFRPLHGKIHLTLMLVCAVIIIMPKSPMPM